MFFELPLEQIGIRWLSAESIPVLGQHHRYITGRHQIAYAVHPRPLQARPALTGVRNLFQDLVPLAGHICAQSFHLLCKGVAAPRLLVCGHAGVEDRSLRAVTVGARHGYSTKSSVGSISRAFAS